MRGSFRSDTRSMSGSEPTRRRCCGCISTSGRGSASLPRSCSRWHLARWSAGSAFASASKASISRCSPSRRPNSPASPSTIWASRAARAACFCPISRNASANGGTCAAGSSCSITSRLRSRLGYQWLAVREDEMAARSLGIDAFRAKMTAVLVSSGMTAVGGVFYAFYYNNLFPAQVFDIQRSIELILGPTVGGLGTVFGPVVGAFILTPLGEGLIALTARLGIDAPGAKAVFYGLTLIAIIYARPNGVWPWLARLLGLKERAS